MWKMKTTILLSALIFFLFTPVMALAHEGIDGTVMDVNGYHLRLIFTNPPTMGENQFQILITGDDGKPVSGAQVEAAVEPVSKETAHGHSPEPTNQESTHGHSPEPASSHDDMAGMPGMDMATATPAPTAHDMQNMDGIDDTHAAETVKLTAAPQAGLYQGVVSFPKEGAWALNIHFMVGNEMLNVSFPIEVAYATPASYGIIAAFLSLNIAIVVSAAVMRRKTSIIVEK